uniref:Uncharacterized protein n=1 Tax=Anguilla anguilla TaxID=7936 RepID=A0A0E9T0V1_ANGAN
MPLPVHQDISLCPSLSFSLSVGCLAVSLSLCWIC